MTVNLSIKNVPDDIAEQVRRRAAQNHLSLQGELTAILEDVAAKSRSLTPSEFLAKIQTKGLRTPTESRRIIREERDEPVSPSRYCSLKSPC